MKKNIINSIKMNLYIRLTSSYNLALFLRDNSGVSEDYIIKIFDFITNDDKLNESVRIKIGNMLLPKYKKYRKNIIGLMVGKSNFDYYNVRSLLFTANLSNEVLDIILEVNNLNDVLNLDREIIGILCNLRNDYMMFKINELNNSNDTDMKVKFIKNTYITSFYKKIIVNNLYNNLSLDECISLYNSLKDNIGSCLPKDYFLLATCKAILKFDNLDAIMSFYQENKEYDFVKLIEDYVYSIDSVNDDMIKMYSLVKSSISFDKYKDRFYSMFDSFIDSGSINDKDVSFYFYFIFNNLINKDNKDVLLYCFDKLVSSSSIIFNNLMSIDLILSYVYSDSVNTLCSYLNEYMDKYDINSLLDIIYQYHNICQLFINNLYSSNYEKFKYLVNNKCNIDSLILESVLIDKRDINLILLFSSNYSVNDIDSVFRLVISSGDVDDILVNSVKFLLSCNSIDTFNMERLICDNNLNDLMLYHKDIIIPYIDSFNSDKASYLHSLLFEDKKSKTLVLE